MNEELVADI